MKDSETSPTKAPAAQAPLPGHGDDAYQDRILPDVSRTFALTIPQLPGDLRKVVTNAYLLCRIADTIEDDADLSAEDIHRFHVQFIEVLEGARDAQRFSDQVSPLLSAQTIAAEHDLVRNTPAIVRVTHSFNDAQRRALLRCVSVMCQGMPHFQRNKSISGLPALEDLDRYCYHVAGVVGEMLTELFCDYAPDIAARRTELMQISTCFGQGLQMTNILKDIWEDRRTDTCWLPRDIFARHGFDLNDLKAGHYDPRFGAGLADLIGVAHTHLRHALDYSLQIPARETGIRRFCLWAVGMAVLTLRKIHNNPEFNAGGEVKISRKTVRATVLATNMAIRSDSGLRALFNLAARGLPRCAVDGAVYSESRAA